MSQRAQDSPQGFSAGTIQLLKNNHLPIIRIVERISRSNSILSSSTASMANQKTRKKPTSTRSISACLLRTKTKIWTCKIQRHILHQLPIKQMSWMQLTGTTLHVDSKIYPSQKDVWVRRTENRRISRSSNQPMRTLLETRSSTGWHALVTLWAMATYGVSLTYFTAMVAVHS